MHGTLEIISLAWKFNSEQLLCKTLNSRMNIIETRAVLNILKTDGILPVTSAVAAVLLSRWEDKGKEHHNYILKTGRLKQSIRPQYPERAPGGRGPGQKNVYALQLIKTDFQTFFQLILILKYSRNICWEKTSPYTVAGHDAYFQFQRM